MVPFRRLLTRERLRSWRNWPKLVGISPEKLFDERSRVSRAGRKARAAGMGPEMRFWERSRYRRAAQVENAAAGRVLSR